MINQGIFFFLSFGIGVLGILLVLFLFFRLMAVDEELKLKRFRKKDAGLSDLLIYSAVVDDGVIVGKNGSFGAAWVYSGNDNASSTNEEREAISFHLNQALAGLGNGWMIHVDSVRRPASKMPDRKYSNFPDKISFLIDEERRQYFESLGNMFEGEFVLTLTWFPPLLAQKKFVDLMFDDDQKKPTSKRTTENLINQFKRAIADFENRLSIGLSLKRLKSYQVTNEDGSISTYDNYLSWIQECITGDKHPIQLPPCPMYLDSLVGGKEFWAGIVPRLDDKYIMAVSIEGFPLDSTPSMLAGLSELPCEVRWNTRFIFLDQHEAVSHLEKYRKKWKQQIRGFIDQVFNLNSSAVNQDALMMTEDAESAIAEANSGMVAFGYYTSVVILRDSDRELLERQARYVQKMVNRLGFSARIETVNTMDAFFGSLPMHAVENVRRPLLHTLNLADLLPTSTIWSGEDKAPCPLYPVMSPALMHCVTSGSTPFRLNLHVRDLGHTFIFGPTGAGKSTHLALLASQFRRYRGMSIFCFDKGMSMYPLTKAIGGSHFNVAADDDSLAFCPLQFLETKGDRAWAAEWIDTILALNGLISTPSQRNAIATAIASLHSSGGKTLSEFTILVQDNAIRDALKQYTIDGQMGHLLDADSDGLSLADFSTFEIENLMNLGEKYALPVLLYLFRRIETSLHGQPAVIFLDEAWLMLGHPAFRDKIREWLKVLRKANCIVVMATQSLSDAARSGILDVIIESTATKIFLPNIYAIQDETSRLYRTMGLNTRQLEIIANGRPKYDYYYVSEKGCRLYSLALGDFALAFVGSSDKDSIELIKKLEKQHGDDWVVEWLKIKNVDLDKFSEALDYCNGTLGKVKQNENEN